MFGLSFAEILIILTLALLVLGPKRLPGLARSLGRGLREVHKVREEVQGLWTGVESQAPTRGRVEDVPREKVEPPVYSEGAASSSGHQSGDGAREQADRESARERPAPDPEDGGRGADERGGSGRGDT